MKKLFLLLLPAIVVCSCSQQAKEISSALFAGKITNPKSEYILLSGEEFSDTIPIDKEGKFFKKIDSLKEGYYHFFHGEEYTDLFLSDGDSLYITLNTDSFDESMRYEGKGAEKNNFLAKTILLEENLDFQNFFSQLEDKFKNACDSIKNTKEQRLKNFLDSFPSITETFKKFEQGKILYSYADNLLNYPNYYPYFTKDTLKKFGNDYYMFLSDIQIEDTFLLGLNEYDSFLKNYLRHKTGKIYEQNSAIKKQKHGYLTLQYKIAKEEFSSISVKEHSTYDMLQMQIMRGTSGIDSLYNDFLSFNTNSKYAQQLSDTYKKWENIAAGKSAPGFKGQNIAGDTVSLADLKGTYIYIDVWATWCGPCIYEIPFLEKIQEEYKNQKIAFVSISIDENKDAWKKMVKEKSMKGIQLIANGAWKSDIATQYNIRGIPRFILIDAAGKIIDSNAPRPSDKKLKELLDGLVAL